MKKLILSMAFSSLLAAGTASAQTLLNEPFNYTVGSNLAGNGSWTALNTGTPPPIAAGNLSVSGLPASSGNSVTLPGGNYQEALNALPLSVSTGTVWYSLAFQLTTQPSGTATYSFALANGNTNYGAPIFLNTDGASGFLIGLANRSNSTPNYSTTSFALNTTVFLVGSYTFNASTADDASALYINPDSTTFGGTAPVATLTAIGGTDLAFINQFLIRGAAGSPAGILDELRVGLSYADVTSNTAVVPEPATYVYILSGLGVMALIRRRLA